jgi:predicted NBD/HSP70 family sugar kinase
MAPVSPASLTGGDRLGYFMRGMIAGIDLGGTQARGGLARPDGQIVFSARTRTALPDSPERLVEWGAEQVGRRSQLGDRVGPAGAVEWARSHP